jgi:hypothetical protein
MTKQEAVRAQIIAAQAQREALAKPPLAKKKPRPNWAATQPVPPLRYPMRRTDPGTRR